MNKLSYILIFIAAIGMTACEDFLDEPQPASSLPSSTAFSSAADIETGLQGAYSLTQQDGLYGRDMFTIASILSDNATWAGSFPSFIEINALQTIVANPHATAFYDDIYEVNNHANLIMKALEEVEDPALTTDLKNQLRGEALFLRALVMFEGIRAFALPYGPSSGSDLGLPIITGAVETINDVTSPTRNTVEEVYNQVISDLEEAANLLPASNSPGRAYADAARALRAVVAFQQRDYPTVNTITGGLVSSGNFSLAATPRDFFTNESSPENILSIVYFAQDPGNMFNWFNKNGRGGDVRVGPDLLENGYLAIIPDAQQTMIDDAGLTAEDLRFTTLTSDSLFVEKYEDPNGGDDIPVVRYAEILLARAESLVRTDGLNQESVDLLNTIRKRAIRLKDADGNEVDNAMIEYALDDFATADDLIETIILERRVEMAFERNRFNDLMRLQRPAVGGVAYDDPRLRMPIPQRALDANPNLQQNPGY